MATPVLDTPRISPGFCGENQNRPRLGTRKSKKIKKTTIHISCDFVPLIYGGISTQSLPPTASLPCVSGELVTSLGGKSGDEI